MRILYVHHTGLVSGAERALMDLVTALEPGILPIVMCPTGRFADQLVTAGIEVREFRGTEGSLRLGVSTTPRAIWDIARSALSVARLAAREDVALIHANSVRAGLIA